MQPHLVFAAATFMMLGSVASAADLPRKSEPVVAPVPAYEVFDYAFGAKLTSDYLFRGITQSNHAPSVSGYGELRFNVLENLQLYVGAAAASVKLPTSPALELDGYFGVRPTFGPLAFDFGGIYYGYPDNTRQYFIDPTGVTFTAPVPGGVPTTPKNPGWWEAYGKAIYTFNDFVAVGAQVAYSPNWVNTGADATYVAGNVKFTLPHGFSVSGEFGRQFLGTSKALYGPTKYVSYNTWNAGVSYTYKVATFDVRYSGTDLNKAECYLNTSDPAGNPVGVVANGVSKWCGHRFMASISFDLTSANLK